MSKESTPPRGILLDVDGTLTNSQRIVSVRTTEAVKELTKKGIKIGAATGRSYAALFKYIFPFFPSDSLHIVAGGGQIVNREGEIIWENKIPSKEVVNICKEVEKMGANYVFGQESVLYCSDKLLSNISKHPWQIDARLPGSLKDWSTPLVSILNINEKVRSYLSEQKTLSVKEIETTYKPSYFDVTTQGVNKGASASIWAEKVGVSLANTLAVGDSINDIELFQVSGSSAAMGQSPENVKAAAKTTIGNTNEDGLAKYLESLID